MSKFLNFWQVDAFTKEPFKGNPAAVFILDDPLDDALMQNIAMEMNLSETVFVLQREGQKPLIRWFTPKQEVDLCGHATLAAAHIYLNEITVNGQEIVFDTMQVGALRVVRQQQADRYTMDFPSRLGERLELELVPQFIVDAISDTKPIGAYQSRDLMLVYEDEQLLRDFTPDFSALAQSDVFIIVTAKSRDSKYDFISRFFAADVGIPEDPVTGSAHCTSAPYWAQQLGKDELIAYQASTRGGELNLKVANDRVAISGDAVTVLSGTMAL